MTTTLEIRRVQESDVNQIYWLRRITFEKINARGLDQETVRIVNAMNNPQRILEKIKDRDAFCLVKDAEEDMTILGTVDIKDYRTDGTSTIGGLFVRHDYLGKGCGTVLLDFIEKYAKEKGAQKARLNSTRYAKNFYLNHGYNPVVGSLNHLTMEKTLK